MDTPVVETPAAPSPPAPPGQSMSLLPTTPSDPLYAAYRDENHPAHRAATEAVQARFREASGAAPELWRDDELENPSVLGHRAPYILSSPRPTEAWPIADAKAVSNVFDSIAAGSKPLAQQALDWLEDGPADRLPDPPPSYTPPDASQTVSALKRGWGDRYNDNLRLAQAVVDAYDARKGGGVRAYLEKTGMGNDPRLIRLAARTGRAWLRQGWRP